MTAHRAEIDWNEVTECARAGLKPAELAKAAGVPESTLRIACERELEQTLRELIEREQARGKGAVLRALMSRVEKGDTKAIQLWMDRFIGPVTKTTSHQHEGNLTLDVQHFANVSIRTPSIVVLPVRLLDIGDARIVQLC